MYYSGVDWRVLHAGSRYPLGSYSRVFSVARSLVFFAASGPLWTSLKILKRITEHVDKQTKQTLIAYQKKSAKAIIDCWTKNPTINPEPKLLQLLKLSICLLSLRLVIFSLLLLNRPRVLLGWTMRQLLSKSSCILGNIFGAWMPEKIYTKVSQCFYEEST